MKKFTCSTCKEVFNTYVCGQSEPRMEGSKFYGTDNQGNIFCEDCIAKSELAEMKDSGRWTGYLTFPCNPGLGRGASKRSRIDIQFLYFQQEELSLSNWPGSLKFKIRGNVVKAGEHNITGIRYDIWFNGPDGFIWHGTQYGDNTQLCHCRRTKKRF